MMLMTLGNLLYPGNVLELKLDKIFELGKEIFFRSITSVYEDEKENIYILDKKAYKVYNFTGNGELQSSFGNRGQGPGDFLDPHSLYVTVEGNIIVNDIKNFVYVLDKQGKFLDRIKVSIGLDLNFLNNNLFYAWIWTHEGKKQVLVNENGKIIQSFFTISKDDFSINLPDETGRMVMFNYSTDEYTPSLLFNRNNKYAILGSSDKYEILLLNHEGKILEKFCRKIKPCVISLEENEYFKNQIINNHNLPEFVKKKFIRKIPRYKTYFNHILISDSYIWIFRIKENVLRQNLPIKVDIFKIGSYYFGTVAVKKVPLFISSKYIYFEETNLDEDMLIVKYKYDIKKQEIEKNVSSK